MSPMGAPARSLCSCFVFSQLEKQGKLRKQRVHILWSTPSLCPPGSGCGAGIFGFIWGFFSSFLRFPCWKLCHALGFVGFLARRCFLRWLQARCSSIPCVQHFCSSLGCASVWKALVKLSGPLCTAPAGRAAQRWHYVHLFLPSALES